MSHLAQPEIGNNLSDLPPLPSVSFLPELKEINETTVSPVKVLEAVGDLAMHADKSDGHIPPPSIPVSWMSDAVQQSHETWTKPTSVDYYHALEDLGAGQTKEAFKAVTETYFGSKTEEEKQIIRDHHQQLLERDDPAAALDAEPRATLVVPVAMAGEKPETLHRTLAELAKQNGAEQDEVILYGNMAEALSAEKQAEAQIAFDQVIEEARRIHPHLKIRSVSVRYGADKMSISQIRHDMIDLIAFDGEQRGFVFDHPVIMIDADTAQMAKTTTEALVAPLTAPDSNKVLVHAETNHLVDQDTGYEPDENGDPIPDDVRKLTIVEEIHRRRKNRYMWGQSRVRGSERMPARGVGYDEEWGMGMALGPVLMAGNYDTNDPLNESRNLIKRIELAKDDIKDAFSITRPKVDWDSPVDTDVVYVKGANVRTSARRREQVWEHWFASDPAGDLDRADQLMDRMGDMTNYDDFFNDDIRKGGAEGQRNLTSEREERLRVILEAAIRDRSPVMSAVLRRYGLEPPLDPFADLD